MCTIGGVDTNYYNEIKKYLIKCEIYDKSKDIAKKQYKRDAW